jgi:hypothetical protein
MDKENDEPMKLPATIYLRRKRCPECSLILDVTRYKNEQDQDVFGTCDCGHVLTEAEYKDNRLDE